MTSEKDNQINDIDVGDISLESILAEYKGSAYINGEKRTPREQLHEEAERIIREVTMVSSATKEQERETVDDTVLTHDNEPALHLPSIKADMVVPVVRDDKDIDVISVSSDLETVDTGHSDNMSRSSSHVSENETEGTPSAAQGSEEAKIRVVPFKNTREPETQSSELNISEVEKAIEREFRYDEDVLNPDKNSRSYSDRYKNGDYEDDEFYEEPTLKQAARRFHIAYHSVALRCYPAAIVSLFMVVLTFAFEAGMILPFGIGLNQQSAVLVQMIALLVVMMLLPDIVLRGATALIRARPNFETLILFSCVFSLFSGLYAYFQDGAGIMTYSAISALSLTFAAFGERLTLSAMRESLKTAASSNSPYGLFADYNRDIEECVLKKASNRIDGFYRNLTHPNIVETAFIYAAPLLLASSLSLAILISFLRGHEEHFLHILSAFLAAAAPFSAVLAFAVPFKIISSSARISGAAIAGWGGAEDIFHTDGVCITDEDLFPSGTVEISSTRIIDKADPRKIVPYTASLIITSGCGLSKIFSETLKTHGARTLKVEDFYCHEGGVGGRIHGEQVTCGNVGFMKLVGVKIEDKMHTKNAIFTAVNKELAGIFVIDYIPVKSVQTALISILKWRIKLFFAVRDFNVSPSMIQKKFKVSLENFKYLETRHTYNISEVNTDKAGRMAAVLIREGLSPYAEAITGGRLLKSSAKIATGFSIFSAVFGVLMMFYVFWTGAFDAARPGNLILFMLAMLGSVLVACLYSRVKK